MKPSLSLIPVVAAALATWLSPALAGPESVPREVQKDQQKEKDEKREKFLASIKCLDTCDTGEDLLRAEAVLAGGFPDSRPVLAEAVASGSTRVRLFAVKILGEKGAAAKDLAVVAAVLGDPETKVRLAAVMAIRRLGKDGFPELIRCLPKEKEPGIRKMTIKTLQEWGNRDAIPHLVRLLRKEKNEGVKGFCIIALEKLSGRRLGGDIAAWEAYADGAALEKQAKALMSERRPPAKETKP